MKKYLKILASALICTIMSPILTACTSEDNPVVTPDPDPSPLADVTIMYYGHGGGDLDEFLVGNMRKLYRAEASCYEHVKIAVEYKFSTQRGLPRYGIELAKQHVEERIKNEGKDADAKISNEIYLRSMDPEGSSTFRFVLDPAQTLREQAEANYLPGKNANITNPDSLTNFINWAAKACPAKKYVLILGDHGGGYTPDAEVFKPNAATTRGVVFDDGNGNNCFSARSIAHAVKAASIRPDVIYFDACMMNTLEYMFELKDVTDYIVASTFVEYADPPFTTLIEVLSKESEQMNLALEKYTEYYVKHFDRPNDDDVFYYDMTTTETAKLDRLGKSMREFTDRLCDTYMNGTAEQKKKIDAVTENAVKVSKEYALYDVGRYMEAMTEALPEVFDEVFGAELEAAFNDCIVGQYTSKYLLERDYQVDYSVLLATKGSYMQAIWEVEGVNPDPEIKTLTSLTYYDADGKYTMYSVTNGDFRKDFTPDYVLKEELQGQWDGTLESVYGALAFDKATGWSRWLLLNEQLPSLWCNNDFDTPLPKISEE